MQCPSCNSELTAEQVELGDCPHCGAAVGERPPVRMPQWDGFQGASLEWEPAIESAEKAFQEQFEPGTASGEATRDVAAPPPAPRQPPESYDSKTVAMGTPGILDEEADSVAGGTQGVREAAGESGPQGEAVSTPPPLLTPGRHGPRDRTRDGDLTPPTSDELQSLAREWGDLEGSATSITIKPSAEGEAAPPTPRSIHDTVESLPRRRVKASGETLEHPEYELLQMLGEGGMGVVWDARQTSIDRTVAVKMIKGPLADKVNQRRKFLAEAVVTGDLDHPNIVPIYDVGTDIHGKLFYAMKRVRGTPWLDVFRDNSLHENLQTLLRVADAVAFAHSRGIIHRDIKPENVMLGGFGEVLLMDWGLALPTREYRKAQTLEFATGMGGTPAYMAPEMAKGPLDRISTASDIYLLGAILYDIITGTAPHAATSVKDCLIAAMRNRIVPTDKEGELVDIAMKALATEPEDRYASVQEFQAVVREYLAHEESLSLAARAREDLNTAQRTDDYRDFARAVFGFEEAYELWDGNRDAKRGISEAKLAYARSARGRGDYDLGLSLLDPDRPDHRALRQQLTEARDEARARQRRLKVARRMTVGMGVALFCVVTGAAVYCYRAWEESDRSWEKEQIAVQNLNDANRNLTAKNDELDRTSQKLQETVAELDGTNTLLGKVNVDLQKSNDDLIMAQKDLEQKQMALVSTNVDLTQQKAATEMALVGEVQARREEQYKAYIAGIGAAAARIDEGAFDVARSILQEFANPTGNEEDGDGGVPWLNWEWGRLMHLCQLYSEQRAASAPIDALAISPDGSRLATGSRDHLARIQDLATGQVLAELRHEGAFVHSVAWSPDGRFLATGSSDPHGFVRLWDVAAVLSGAEHAGRPLTGHSQAATRVRFSADGRWLLSCSFDKTARIWDVSDVRQPRLACMLEGHDWWVWDGAFAPDFAPDKPDGDNRIVTVDQDGQVILWQYKPADAATARVGEQSSQLQFRKDRLFLGHEGPVYSVDFVVSDGEAWIATGGYDNRVLVWRPDDAEPYKVDTVFEPRQQDANFREFRGHTDAVQSVSFSRDGKLLVSAGRDNSVWVWSMEGGGQKFRLRGHSSEVRAAVVTPDGRQIVSAGLDQQILVWNTEGEQELKVLQSQHFSRHDDAVLSARFSRDDSEIITASSDRTARIWNSQTASRTAELREGHAYLVSGAVLFPDGLTLATAAADNSVRLWDVRSGAERLILLDTGRSGVLALSHDSAWLLTGGPEHAARLWAVDGMAPQAGGMPEPHVLEAHSGHVTAAACSPVANLAVTGDVNGRTVLWDLDTRAVVWNRRYHNQRINALQFTPDGRGVLIASSDNAVCRVDVSTGEESARLTTGGPVRAMDLSADGTRVILAESATPVTERTDSMLLVWDPARSEVVGRMGPLPLSVQSIMAVPDGSAALVACGDNTVRRIALDAAAPELDSLPAPLVAVEPAYGALAAAALSVDGGLLVTMNGTDARLFNANTGRELMAFRPQDALADAEFSPDGKLIITASWDGTVRFWNAGQRPPEAVATLAAHEQFINSAVFSPDGSLVLTASDDRTARLWNTQTRTLVHELKGHAGPVNHAVFSPDGALVLTVSDDRTARLWDVRTGTPVGDPFRDGHSRPILSGAFSVDGQRIVTGSEDNLALVWTVEDRSPVAILGGHTAAITAVAFSVDDARVFTASRDSTVKVWDVSRDGLAFLASAAEGDGPRPAVKGVDLLTLSGHEREITSLAISADGRKLLTGSRDRTAIIWNAMEWPRAPQPRAALGGGHATAAFMERP